MMDRSHQKIFSHGQVDAVSRQASKSIVKNGSTLILPSTRQSSSMDLLKKKAIKLLSQMWHTMVLSPKSLLSITPMMMSVLLN